MGKLSYLLAEDYIKPKIYFKPKQAPIVNTSYSSDARKQFEGLEHLTKLICSNKGFIVNAFQIDYYQLLPKLISETLKKNNQHKTLYILGPELSLSILKKSRKNVYDQFHNDFQYISIEHDPHFIVEKCLSLLNEGHILYILPEVSATWRPEEALQLNDHFIPFCSCVLSQKSQVPILPSVQALKGDKIILHHQNSPEDYSGPFESKIEKQTNDIYKLLGDLGA